MRSPTPLPWARADLQLQTVAASANAVLSQAQAHSAAAPQQPQAPQWNVRKRVYAVSLAVERWIYNVLCIRDSFTSKAQLAHRPGGCQPDGSRAPSLAHAILTSNSAQHDVVQHVCLFDLKQAGQSRCARPAGSALCPQPAGPDSLAAAQPLPAGLPGAAGAHSSGSVSQEGGRAKTPLMLPGGMYPGSITDLPTVSLSIVATLVLAQKYTELLWQEEKSRRATSSSAG